MSHMLGAQCLNDHTGSAPSVNDDVAGKEAANDAIAHNGTDNHDVNDDNETANDDVDLYVTTTCSAPRDSSNTLASSFLTMLTMVQPWDLEADMASCGRATMVQFLDTCLLCQFDHHLAQLAVSHGMNEGWGSLGLGSVKDTHSYGHRRL